MLGSVFLIKIFCQSKVTSIKAKKLWRASWWIDLLMFLCANQRKTSFVDSSKKWFCVAFFLILDPLLYFFAFEGSSGEIFFKDLLVYKAQDFHGLRINLIRYCNAFWQLIMCKFQKNPFGIRLLFSRDFFKCCPNGYGYAP